MRTLISAKRAGFCKGVARAVEMALSQARQHGACYTLGPIIHNKTVVSELSGQGVLCVSDLSEVPSGGTVVIRSHGAKPEVYEQIKALGLRLCDATCTDVGHQHGIAAAESDAGRRVLILGDAAHPEIAGLAGWCREPLIFKDIKAMRMLFESGAADRDEPLSFVSQTTCRREDYELCVDFLKKECTNAKIFDTICNATMLRQREAAELAERCDAMLVVGDPESANTLHLADICRKYCSQVFLVENAAQARMLFHGSHTADMLSADRLSLAPNASVGLTAGASAPARVIKEVKQVMSDELNVHSETEQSFEEMLEQSFKTLTTGDKVTGVITALTPTEIHVDLGTKHAGYIPVAELSDDPDYKVEEHLKVGENIETFVMRVNDVEGTALLSKKRVDAVQSWEDIEAARAAHNMVEGVVTEENKGGLVVSVRGVRVFVPASQSGIPKDGDLSAIKGKKVKLYVTEVNRARRRVVGSIRAAQNDERRILSDELWAGIEEGKRYNGTVKSMTSYGAFVDVGGVDGMVHVSELSWSRVAHPSEVVEVGDKIEVYVLSFDREKRKISLGYKDKSKNPWNQFIETYKSGDVVNVKVVKLAPFGAFCEIMPGVDGLVHISHISDQRIGMPGDVLKEGQMVDVKILEINHEHKKVSLSIRALSAYEQSGGDDGDNADAADTEDRIVYPLPADAEPEDQTAEPAQSDESIVFPEVEPAAQAIEEAAQTEADAKPEKAPRAKAKAKAKAKDVPEEE